MAASVVQAATFVSGTAVSQQIVLPSVSAGNVLLVWAQCAGARTFSVADDVNVGAYAEALVYTADTYDGGVYYKTNAGAGTTTITVTASASATFWIGAMEIAGAHATLPIDITGAFNDSVNDLSHHCLASPGQTIAAGSVIVCGGYLSGGVTDFAAGSGYTEWVDGQGHRAFVQYQANAGELTSERGTFTGTVTNRTSNNMFVSVKQAAVAAAPGDGGGIILVL